MQDKFALHQETVSSDLEEKWQDMDTKHRMFHLKIQEAFDNFKTSLELEQTKRMRQIGDIVSDEKKILS